MSTSQRLTKKQKKGLAFRERKTCKRQQGKGRHRNGLSGMEYNAIPSMEGEALLGLDGDPAQDQGVPHKEDSKACRHEEGDVVQHKKGKGGSKSKGDAEKEDVSVSVAVLKGKKRMRESEGVEAEGREGHVEVEGRSKIKRKKVAEEEVEEEEKQQKNQPKQKFILFIGNLKYTTTKEKIENHFALCDPPPRIRLLTPKVRAGQKSKSKGCAFLEFTHRNALQQALKLHQSNLEGRLINVELTAGGGGKSESRLAKVRERNKALLGERVKRVENHEENGPSLLNQPQRPQRHSMTSGLEHTPMTRKTWTVGDVDDKQSRRGHRKKSKSRVQLWTTGANAIPVD